MALHGWPPASDCGRRRHAGVLYIHAQRPLICVLPCNRFLIANDFLQNVDAAPLVFPSDDVAATPAGLPPMQQILDVEVSDEEQELAKDGDRTHVEAAATGSVDEPHDGGAALMEIEDTMGAKQDKSNGGAKTSVSKGVLSINGHADKAAGPGIGSAVGIAVATEARAENPEEIMLAD